MPIALVPIAPVVAIVSVADCLDPVVPVSDCLDPPTSEVVPVVPVADYLDPPSSNFVPIAVVPVVAIVPVVPVADQAAEASVMLSSRVFVFAVAFSLQWLESSPSPSILNLRASSMFTTSRIRGLDDGPRLPRSLLLNDRFHGLERLLRGLVDGLRLSDL